MKYPCPHFGQNTLFLASLFPEIVYTLYNPFPDFFPAAGFFAALGKDLYIQLRDRIKKLLSEDQPKAGAIYYSYLAFDIGSTVLYFEVDRINVYSIDRAYEKIIEDFPIIKKEVERLIQFKPNKLTGKFDSITFIFDDLDDQWIIAHFNKY